MKSKSLVLLAGAAMGLTAGMSFADDADRARQAELLADAQGRSSLLAAGASVSHENGHFTFTDASGNNSMYLGIFGQYRYNLNFGRERSRGDNNDVVIGGQLSRVKLFGGGTVGSPDFEYYFQFGASGAEGVDDFFGSGGGGLGVEDFWAKWNFEGGMYVRAGQGRPMQSFETMYQPWQLQTFERSLGHALFSIDRTQFVEVGFGDEQFDFAVFIDDGSRTQGADFWSPVEADIGIGARVNFLIDGTPDVFSHQSAMQGSPGGTRVGVGAHYETGGDTGFFTEDFRMWLINGGVEHKGDGYSIRGEVYYQNYKMRGGDRLSNWALHIAGGVNIDPQLEIYLFWDSIFLDKDISDDKDFHRVGAGVNYFPFENSTAVRLRAEFFVFVDDNEELAEFASGGAGIRGTGAPISLYNILGTEGNELGIGFGIDVLN